MVPVRRVTIAVFVISGLLAGFGGLVLMGRVGSMKHTAVGLLLYGVLNNGLDQLDMNIYLKPYARGAFLLAAIALNIAALRIASRAQTRGDLGNIHDETNALINEPIPHTKAPMSEPNTNEMESR